MTRLPTLSVCILVASSSAPAQVVLYGMRANGSLVQVDSQSGLATAVGSSGIPCVGAASPPSCQWPTVCVEYLITARADTPSIGSLLCINRWTGEVWQPLSTSALPEGSSVRSITARNALLYLIVRSPTSDLLASVSVYGGPWQIIGPTGRTDLEALAWSQTGTLYALGTSGGGALYSINTTTGVAALIGGGPFGNDLGALFEMPGGELLCCGANLRRVDRLTGATTLIGPTGFSDIRGLAISFRDDCYAECDHSINGWLNANDFQCFLDRFAAGDPWANCDQSTIPPVLTANDFQCYLNAFAAGCS